MINNALELLATQLREFIGTRGHGSDVGVALGNVAMLDAPDGNGTGAENFDSGVMITLVNLEEESTFKNLPNYQKTPNGGVRYQNPPVFLNLYLLFTAHAGKYTESLRLLSDVVRFFQGKTVFNLKNAANSSTENDPDLADMQLILDLYTMTFEQINHLWGSLGGKQMPFAMYKARLVRILDRRQTASGVVIEEIDSKENA